MRHLVLLFALVAGGLGAAGCADDAEPADPGSDPTVSEALTLRGEVVGPRADGAALRVNHEAVPSLGMEAMAMDLALADPSLGAGLAPGDKVSLTIEASPRLRITAVERLPADTPLALAAPDTTAADTTAAP